MLGIKGEAEGYAMAEEANRMERRILRALEPIANGEDARIVCAALVMAASAIARHSGLPPEMFAYIADTAVTVNQDILDGLSAEARLKAH